YPDAAAVADALAPFAQQCDLPALLADPTGPRAAWKVQAEAGTRRRRPWRWLPLSLVVLAAIALSLAALAFLLWSKKEAPHGALPTSAEEARQLQQRWVKYLRQPVVVTDGLGIELALVPPGTGEEFPNQLVKLARPLRFGTTEVTRGQFRAFVEATG